MAERVDKLDAFLSFNERAVLTHVGHMRMDVAQKRAAERFEVFDANWWAVEGAAADFDDVVRLEEMEEAAEGRKRQGGRQ